MFVLKLNISICFAKYFATYITPFMLLLQGTNYICEDYINYIQRRINLFHFARTNNFDTVLTNTCMFVTEVGKILE